MMNKSNEKCSRCGKKVGSSYIVVEDYIYCGDCAEYLDARAMDEDKLSDVKEDEI